MIKDKSKKTRQTKRLAFVCFSILLAMLILQACGTKKLPEGARIIEDTPTRQHPTVTPYVTPTIQAADLMTATAVALQTHAGAVRFMSYNIQEGGRDKLPQIISVLKSYNADVLSLEETNGWQLNDFAIAKQVAGDLGMEYVYCASGSPAVDKNGNTFDMVLLSKLEIKSSETFADVQNCLIRAELATPDGSTVQVFATQLNPDFDSTGCVNVENLIKVSQPLTTGAAVLMGDMTMPPPSLSMGYPQSQIVCPPLLEAAGWTFLTDVSRSEHVWVTQTMAEKKFNVLPPPMSEPFVTKSLMRSISDHSPVAVDFFFP